MRQGLKTIIVLFIDILELPELIKALNYQEEVARLTARPKVSPRRFIFMIA